jgi:hypothetical protein
MCLVSGNRYFLLFPARSIYELGTKGRSIYRGTGPPEEATSGSIPRRWAAPMFYREGLAFPQLCYLERAYRYLPISDIASLILRMKAQNVVNLPGYGASRGGNVRV